MTKTFARVAGWLALLLGILGFFVTDLLGLIQFDLTTNIVNLVLGVIGIAAAQNANGAKAYALWLGAIYLIFGIIGFFFVELAGMHLEVTENLLHIVLGAWGLYAAFSGKSATE
jgi:Domain of unknown function (DUF4383)